MSKKVVVYKSKYGSTKKYAEWLAEKINADIFENSDVTVAKLNEYDTIIYGGGIYANGIAGFSLIKKNYNKLKNKKLIVFAVVASPFEDGTIGAIKKNNFTEEMMGVDCFYLRGAFNYSKMKVPDKILMNMLKGMLNKKNGQLENWEKALLENYDKACDWKAIENIEPIIKCIEN